MSKHSNTSGSKRLDTAIVVALIGLIGTLIAAFLASPLLEKLLSSEPSSANPSESSNTSSNGTPVTGNHIDLNQTVTGTLYGAEAGIWIFNEGPAKVTIVLDTRPFGSALIILKDPTGVERAYVDEQTPGVARLVNFEIPTTGDYTIWVRNPQNEQVDYKLTVQNALTPPP